MQYSPLESKIEEIIAPALAADGYSVVRVRVSQGEESSVQIMAEHTDGSGITLDECSKISRTISAKLDVEDPISTKYHLEVSSPGMERPLTKVQDFQKYTGREIKLTTATPVDGRKRFKGVLKGIDGDTVTMLAELNSTEHEIKIPYEEIVAANLLVTEDSIRKILNKKL